MKRIEIQNLTKYGCPDWLNLANGKIRVGNVAIGTISFTKDSWYIKIPVPSAGFKKRDGKRYPSGMFERERHTLPQALISAACHVASRKDTVCRRPGLPKETSVREFVERFYSGEKLAIPAGLFGEERPAEERNTTQPLITVPEQSLSALQWEKSGGIGRKAG